jgi:hypothetical protein
MIREIYVAFTVLTGTEVWRNTEEGFYTPQMN